MYLEEKWFGEASARIGETPEWIRIGGTPEWMRPIFHAAADIMDKRGIAKFTLETKDGVCMVGAIMIALQGHTQVSDVILKQLNPLTDRISNFLGTRVCTYNDTPERTKEEAVAALHACAEA